jgi:hypothetical protein
MMPVTNDFKPIILIGAARSGTKMLRDVVAAHPAVDCVPYDINYVWRIGNEDVQDDELKRETLTAQNVDKIRKLITRYHDGAPFLIEKTVSNCLRVTYVSSVLPEARFIHLVRNGVDVVESAQRQWVAKPDWQYIVRKARTFPLTSAFNYATSYGLNSLRKLFDNGQSKSGTWGPRYRGIEDDMREKSILEVCAIQWSCCVRMAMVDLGRLPSSDVLTIVYEDFVDNPGEQLARVAAFINVDPAPFLGAVRETGITRENVGKAKHRLTAKELDLIMPYIERELQLLNYA